jgi:predicted O-linked N-acetylglucosamine transferase (SPINDLY family)
VYSQRMENIRTRLRANPTDGLAASEMILLRHDIAKAFQAAPSAQLEILYKGELGIVHDTLLSMGVSGYPAQPTERVTIASILQRLSQRPADPGALNLILAGMLYEGPHKLLPCEALPMIPIWLLDNIMKYALGMPWLFKEKGEIELYYQHLARWVNYLHANILSNRASADWHEVLRGFMGHATFISLYFSWQNPREIYRQRAELIEFALALWGCRPDFAFGPRSPNSGKIRFGVLAPNFSPRSETFATLPVYAHLDREAIEVILLAPASRDKPALEGYCASYADRLIDIPDDLVQSVDAIRALDLDVLWIGSNLSAGASKFVSLGAHRLARIQITGGCTPTTSGFHSIDAYVSGNLTEPDIGAQDQYTEQLICLNGPVLCFDFGPGGNQTATQIFDRVKLNIPEQAVVYASGTNFFKITPELEELWIRILASSPDSMLLLYPFNPNWIKSYPAGPFLNRISSTCRRLGVDGKRLVILPPLPTIADIRVMLASVADVYLDSFPHSGMTSLIDPLLAGVPTVVLEGNSQRSRMASGALRDMNITGLIAGDQEAYLELAMRLGRDKNLRLQYAQQVRQQIAKPPKFLDTRWYSDEITRLLKKLVLHQS